METYFSFTRRNPGHWDVYDKDHRIFCIRGVLGNVVICDERTTPATQHTGLKNVAAAVAVITDILMS